MRTTPILSSVALACIGNGAFAAPGDLDPTFGVGGIVITDVTTALDVSKAIAIQPDGRIIVAGNKSTGPDLLLVRYNDDGSVDPSFNGTGRVVVASVGTTESGKAVVVQPDGKILVAGGNPDFTLARFNANGTLDSTFGTNGRVTTAIGLGTDLGNGMALQADGKIIVAGAAQNPSTHDFAVARFNANGTLDTTFNIRAPMGEKKSGKGRQFKQLGFHALRHTMISNFANADIPADVRKEIAGHSSDEIHRRYVHLDLSTPRRAIERIGSILPRNAGERR